MGTKFGNKLYNGQGYVRLIEVLPAEVPEGMTSRDAWIAKVAKISTQTELDNIQVYNLIEKLLKLRHLSPFEQAVLTFEIKAPVMVFWQLDRHRTFRYGSHLRRSGRYTKFSKEDFYIPEFLEKFSVDNSTYKDKFLELIDTNYALYENAINSGIPKELARIFLPAFSILYEEVMSIDLRNLLHFFSLRMTKYAQDEIRELATSMYQLTGLVFPYTTKIFHSMLVENEFTEYDFNCE